MALGPGKYDDIITIVAKRAEAKTGVIIAIVDGNLGSGFCVQGTLEFQLALPRVLRLMADDIERDLANLKKSVTQ